MTRRAILLTVRYWLIAIVIGLVLVTAPTWGEFVDSIAEPDRVEMQTAERHWQEYERMRGMLWTSTNTEK
jgi:hypothetical protein